MQAPSGILSALHQVQQEDNSLATLAELPQARLMQMAQNGLIDKDQIGVILAKKAEIADMKAQNQALLAQGRQGGLPPSTVIEKIIAANAAREAAPAPTDARDMGVANLPLPEDMYSPKRMAGGGIVAFAGEDGSLVEDKFDPYKDYIEARDKLAAREQQINELSQGRLGRAMMPLAAGLLSQTKTGGGGFSDLLAGVGAGLPGAMKQYESEQASQSKALQDLAEKRAELSAGMVKSKLAKEAALEKTSNQKDFVNRYIKSQQIQGDKRDPEVIAQEGAERFLALSGAAAMRGSAAVTTAETGATRATTDLYDKARDNVDKSLSSNYNSPENRKLRQLQKEDKKNNTNTAETYKNELYKNEESRLKGNAPAPAAPAATKASASVPEGTTKGKFVAGKGYEALDKNGKLIGYFQ